MEKYANYFKYKNGKSYHIKINNSSKIFTFVSFIPRLNFYEGIDNRKFELLKMELLTKKPIDILVKLLKNYTDKPHFWAFKKGNLQYLGISFSKFKNFLKRKGYKFTYPIITDTYFFIFTGESDVPKSYKFFLYFNNSRIPYVDSIKIFKEENIGLDFPMKLKRVGIIKSEEKFIWGLPEEVPKLIAKGGQLYRKEIYDFFFLIKSFKKKSKSVIDSLSHIIVFNRDESIQFNEKRKFFMGCINWIELDELIILSADIHLYRKNNEFF